MKKLTISLVIALSLITGCTNTSNNMSFKTPFIKQENEQKDTNTYETDYYYKPLIYIQIKNPINGKSEIVSATIDTGSDNCYISRNLADHLGLEQSSKSPLTTYTANGSMDVHAVEAEYTLASEKKISNFPIQETHFYINETNTYNMVLGFRGFIDKFQEVKIHYPEYIEFTW